MKTVEGFRRETAQIFLENKDMGNGGGGGARESHKKLLGGITSVKKHSKGGSG